MSASRGVRAPAVREAAGHDPDDGTVRRSYEADLSDRGTDLRERRAAASQSQRSQPQRAVDTGPTQRKRGGFRYLYVVDAVTLYALMWVITLIRLAFDLPRDRLSQYVAEYTSGFAVAVAIHMTVYYFGGLYEPEQRLGLTWRLPRATLLTLVAICGDGLAALLTGRFLMPRANLIVLAAAASLLMTLNRAVARTVRTRRSGVPRVLLAGDAGDINRARQHLSESEPGAVVAGECHGECHTEPALLSAQVRRLRASDVLLLSGQHLESVYPEPLGELERWNVGVYRRITPSDTLLGLRRTIQIGGMPFVALRTQALPPSRLRFKRLLDLLHLLVLTPVAMPLAAALAVWVRIRAGAGVIYRQERVGCHGRVFTMLKFRTMTHEAEPEGRPVLASLNDQRVIVGLAWMRRTRLDELPQLWNVAAGDMSIVGPRPERPDLVAEYSRSIRGYERRHDMPPGITGLAQTQGHYQTDPVYKLGHDLQYVPNWSPVLDWEIMLKSLHVMALGSAR